MINKDLPEKKEAKDREDQVINRAHIKQEDMMLI